MVGERTPRCPSTRAQTCPHRRYHALAQARVNTRAEIHACSFWATEERLRPEHQGHSPPPLVSLSVSVPSPYDSSYLPRSLLFFLWVRVTVGFSSMPSSLGLWPLCSSLSPLLLTPLCASVWRSISLTPNLCVSGLCLFLPFSVSTCPCLLSLSSNCPVLCFPSPCLCLSLSLSACVSVSGSVSLTL